MSRGRAPSQSVCVVASSRLVREGLKIALSAATDFDVRGVDAVDSELEVGVLIVADRGLDDASARALLSCAPLVLVSADRDGLVCEGVRRVDRARGSQGFVELLIDPQRRVRRRWSAPEVERPPLTPQEAAVLRLLLGGATAVDVSRTLGLSLRTVESHKRSVLSKSGARTVAQLVAMHSRGLVEELEAANR